MIAALFPGQGSQAVGMARDLYDGSEVARRVLDEAEAALPGLLDLMWRGPEDALKLTANQQPALVAAGSLALRDSVQLVRKRGEYMQEAVPAGQGAMAAVMKTDRAHVERVCAETEGVVEIANLNAPEQTVISGEAGAVGTAGERLRAEGARVVTLNVSAPFHCSLMRPAAVALAGDLRRVQFGRPQFSIICNVTADVLRGVGEVPELLERQVTAPVRWVETLERLGGLGVTRFVEFGSGSVLTGLVKRTLKGASAVVVTDMQSLKEAL